ncbi:MAG: MaoC family dehydratase N-terminal domain-containing protein, partial [Candidatus Rokubacteria bacterium]|nr:MaoC family dehydratase N-terminal domain-containing protein [Candidatus Rokubacteria bacterium]
MTASGPIRAAIVGSEVGPFTQTVDARWLMAYAAGLGETDARYYDTLGSHGPAAHPLFPVCYEWPVALEIRAKTIADELAPLSVHATHHVVIHRAPRAGDRLLTSARVIAIGRRRRGTLVVTRFTTVDERGAPVTTTDYGSVYRG